MPILTPGWSPTIQHGSAYFIDWTHPITRGLYFAHALNDLSPVPTFTTAPLASYTRGASSRISICNAGVGFQAASTAATSGFYWTGLTLNQTQGSMFAYVTLGFSPTDGLGHFTNHTQAAGGVSQFTIVKWTDNNWYFGWYDTGHDTRAAVAANGTYNVGDTTVIGGTWNAAGTKFWINNVNKATNVTAPFTHDTTTERFTVGNAKALATYAWSQGASFANSIIYWMTVWDRVLDDSEIIYLGSNPMCFFLPAETEMPALFITVAAPTLSQKHFRFRTDAGGVDATPTWGADEDAA